ncbi:MAG TPA: hypothetical protein VF033_07650 [Steroidobacteraceae bacterium]|jgi:hypothetical protein
MSTQPEPPPDDREQQAADDDCFIQWVALVVLLACWLAEAYM